MSVWQIVRPTPVHSACLRQSMSATGYYYDNASVESNIASIKNVAIAPCRPFDSHAEAEFWSRNKNETLLFYGTIFYSNGD